MFACRHQKKKDDFSVVVEDQPPLCNSADYHRSDSAKSSRCSFVSSQSSSLFNAPVAGSPSTLQLRVPVNTDDKKTDKVIFPSRSSLSSKSFHPPCMNCTKPDKTYLSGTSSPTQWFTGFSPGSISGSRGEGGGVDAAESLGMASVTTPGNNCFSPTLISDQDAPPWIRQQLAKMETENPPKKKNLKESNNKGDNKCIHCPDTRGNDSSGTMTHFNDKMEDEEMLSSLTRAPVSESSSPTALTRPKVPSRPPFTTSSGEKLTPISTQAPTSFHPYRGCVREPSGTVSAATRIGVGSTYGLGATVGSLFPGSALQVGTYELDALPAEASLTAGLYSGFSKMPGGGSYIPMSFPVQGDFEGSPREVFEGENALQSVDPDFFRSRLTEDGTSMSTVGSPVVGRKEITDTVSQARHAAGNFSFAGKPHFFTDAPSEFMQPSALASSFPDVPMNSILSQGDNSTILGGSLPRKSGNDELEMDAGSGFFPLRSPSFHVDPARIFNDIYSLPGGRVENTNKSSSRRHPLSNSDNSPLSCACASAYDTNPLYDGMMNDPDAPPFMRK